MLTAAAKKKVAQQVKSSQAASRKMRAHVAAADRRVLVGDRRGRLSTSTKKSPAKRRSRRKKG